MHPSDDAFNFDQCSDCNFVFINPRVSRDELSKFYTSHYLPYRGDKAWGKYAAVVRKSQQKLDLKRFKRVIGSQKISQNSLILDVGCGQPSFLKLCQDKLDCNTLGLDFSDKGWIDDKSNFKNLNLKVGEIKDLPSNLQPDVITMWHYLEHDYNLNQNLNYLKTISKPETKLFIEVPNFDSISRKKFGKYWSGWHTPRHTSLFSPSNIEILLNKNAWKVEKILNYGSLNPYLLFWMSRMEKKGIDWSQSMESRFLNFLWQMILFLPYKLREKTLSLGVMTVVASPKT